MPAAPKVFGIILAGGEGKRLMPLTEDRAKPAVPFGGQHRLIDFAISNLINSGLRQIVVLTQYKSHSLDKHVAQTWRMSSLLGNYVAPVPAQQRLGHLRDAEVMRDAEFCVAQPVVGALRVEAGRNQDLAAALRDRVQNHCSRSNFRVDDLRLVDHPHAGVVRPGHGVAVRVLDLGVDDDFADLDELTLEEKLALFT